ncbi:MAG: helix-turn-helix transcriptional regulator [Anaerolineaceae bacterium]|nr:helix-turn-helix transcriptional regulator [Anaerolineaceae bacterium]
MMLIQTETREKPGEIVRQWRKVRRLSQMDLAFAANVSARHLSFVETGRSHPSDDLILRLSDALELPLRHTNTLLIAAGYAPRYTSWSLADDHTGMVRAALDHLMRQHEPYPAVVVDRGYDVVMANDGFRRLSTWLVGDESLLARHNNTFRALFAPDGWWRYVVNWDVVQGTLLKRLREESILFQSAALAELYEACLADSRRTGVVPDESETETQLPVLTLTFRKGDVELSFFSTVTTFGTAIDVTIQELHIETLFAADAETQGFCRAVLGR